jgi:hypothetical protein
MIQIGTSLTVIYNLIIIVNLLRGNVFECLLKNGAY